MRNWRSGASKWDRALAITLVAGVAMLLLVGLVSAIAYGSQRITSDATSLHNADEVLRSSTVVRAQLALASYAGEVDRQFGTDSSEAIAVSLDEAQLALDDLITGLVALSGAELDTSTVEPHAERFVASAAESIRLIENGDSQSARDLVGGLLNDDFGELVGALVAVRDGIAASVRSSDVLLSQIENIARFLVAFLLPAAVIFIYRDLLRRQARQTELESRLESARQIAEAREEFIANASHELRTPLTSITGLALILEDHPVIKEDETSSELLDLVIRESSDLNRMVEDLLTAARLDAGALSYTFDDVDPTVEADEVAESMRRAGAAVKVDCEPALVRADSVRLRQVVRNLLSNAIKYGGSNIRISGHVEGRTYLCEVIDDGDGVPAGVADRLFERFVHQGRQTAVSSSVGLGLSIVHALASGMGGSVAYSRNGGKTHFTVRLPLAEAAQSDLEPIGALVVRDLNSLSS